MKNQIAVKHPSKLARAGRPALFMAALLVLAAAAPGGQVRDQRGYIGAFIDTADNLTCQVDGLELANLGTYRCKTPVGGAKMVTLPAGNLFGVAAGTYGPMVTDGYYLMVAPLSAGKHTLHFTAGLGAGVPMDVTYHLTVQGGGPRPPCDWDKD
jgi:hypothetical protein